MVAATRKHTPGVTSAADWKKSTSEQPIELPSGKFALIGRSNFKALLAAGVIPNSLMSIVQKSLDTGQNQVNPGELVSDPAKMDEMLEMVDNIAIFAVKEPQIHPIPALGKKKDDALLYVDEIEDEDKAFIFQYVTGGTKDLEQFRQQATEQLASLQSGAAMAMPAKRAPGNAAARRR